jgi:hypothetical protein
MSFCFRGVNSQQAGYYDYGTRSLIACCNRTREKADMVPSSECHGLDIGPGWKGTAGFPGRVIRHKQKRLGNLFPSLS